ncbi:MAG: M1 family metallopeptidase [Ignavibacteria bacterium]|nr:M1 family metallopeptidase [Ignavibacteria bacterium]
MKENSLLRCVFLFFSILQLQSLTASAKDFFIGNVSNKELNINSYNFQNKKFSSDNVQQVTKRPYDVLRYDLYLDWYNLMKDPKAMDSLSRVWLGINKITVRIQQDNFNLVELDARDLVIDSVFVEFDNFKQKITPTPQIANRRLNIGLPKNLNSGDSAVVTVFYKYARNIPEENYRGFFLYPKGKFVGRLPAPFYDSVFVEERIAYTMSQPNDARFWLPSNDNPYDKADATITVRVPKEYTVASNGILNKVENEGDSAKVYYWESDKPIATYLMAVTASIFYRYSDWYRKITNPLDSIEVPYYVWEKDYLSTKTDGSEYNAKNTFKPTVKMLEFYSNIFGEYPFAKYGTVVLMPFHYGGMEHQTITSLNRALLRQNAQFVVAHELAHQWIGNYVTCASWDDIWFNEGGATWSEALWAEYLWGKPGYDLFILSSRRRYLRDGGLNLPPIYGLPINTIFGDYSVLVYQKASWIYHMLKEFVGDTLFFKTLRSFFDKNKFNSIQNEDFINHFKENIQNSPIDFDKFFEQWLFKAGHPIFSISSSINHFKNDSGFHNANITILQTQIGANVPEVFQSPVRLIFKSGDSIHKQIFYIKERFETFSTALPFFPDSIFVDTTYVLCEQFESTLYVYDNNVKIDVELNSDFFEGANSLCLTITTPFSSSFQVSIYDVKGNLVAKPQIFELGQGIHKILVFKGLDFAPGLYLIKVSNGSFQKVIPYLNL